MDENKDDIIIKPFHFNDTKSLKLLGELLSNESSLAIINILIDQELFTNQISEKTGIRVSLVVHHMKKLGELGILEVKLKKLKRKGKEHKFYTIKNNILLLKDSKEKTDEKRLLKKMFKKGIKFTIIGLAAFSAWILTIFNQSSMLTDSSQPTNDPIVIPLIIIIIGLILVLIKKRKKS